MITLGGELLDCAHLMIFLHTRLFSPRVLLVLRSVSFHCHSDRLLPASWKTLGTVSMPNHFNVTSRHYPKGIDTSLLLKLLGGGSVASNVPKYRVVLLFPGH